MGTPCVGSSERISDAATSVREIASCDVGDDFVTPDIAEIGRALADPHEPIAKRIRCLFAARHVGGPEAVDALLSGLQDDSVLLVHEIAYVLGQLGDYRATPALLGLLRDQKRNCMIRHEAAEALAAIGATEFMSELEHYKSDPSKPVSETCQLALRSLQEKARISSETCQDIGEDQPPSKFQTTDPVARPAKSTDVDSLARTMINPDEELYIRYEALFALRDLDTPQAQKYIIRALVNDKTSALFRHEVAFVLGQIQSPESIEALVACLGDSDEHPMARHEAAIALGSAACGKLSADQKAFAILALRRCSTCDDRVVAESCLVGLDMIAREAPL